MPSAAVSWNEGAQRAKGHAADDKASGSATCASRARSKRCGGRSTPARTDPTIEQEACIPWNCPTS
jgi:hypothetical protein